MVLQKGTVIAMNLRKTPVLVLNASYEAITIVNARRALVLVSKGAAVVEEPTNILVHKLVYLPSVIRLRTYRRTPHRRPQATRRNIFRRDGMQCMYCGAHAPKVVLELEHILPKSRGGRDDWDNLVASCHSCNQKKGDRLPEEAGMALIRRPLPATVHTNRFMLKTLGAEVPSWSKFLWHDSDGDRRFAFN